MYTLFVREFLKKGYNGDRARTKTPYVDYKIVLQDNNSKKEAVLQYISGYDTFLLMLKIWNKFKKNYKNI